MAQGESPAVPTLTSGNIFVGNASNIATDTAMSGDITITNTGATTIKTNVSLAGSPTTTTQSAGDNTTKIATTAFVLANAVTETGASTDNTLPRFDGTTGKALQTSNVVLTDSDELYLARVWEIADSSTTRTLSATVDMLSTITFSNAGTITVTLPNNLPKGFVCTMVQSGTGQIQLSAASGATLNNRQGYTASAGQYAVITVEVVANSGGSSAIYYLSGDAGGATSAVSSPIINSLQQVAVTIAAGQTSGTATITAVTAANSYCHWQGTKGAVSTFAATTCFASVTLTNATTVTATRSTSDASNALVVQVTVVEFIASTIIQSIQQGTIAIGNAATSNTATISAVTTNNAFVHFQGQTFGATTDETNFARCTANVVLTNSTTVTATRNTASATTLTVGFVVVEFKAGVLNSATQSITTTTSATLQTITATDPRYSILIYGGDALAVTTTNVASRASLDQANQEKALSSTNASVSTSAKYMLVEFTAVQVNQIQRVFGLIAANATSGTSSISPSVTTNKALVNYLGHWSSASLTTMNQAWETATLTNATTATYTRNTSHATISLTNQCQIIDFK